MSLIGPKGCIAYTSIVALGQLKWTQVMPNVEELRGLIFQYASGDSHGQQVKVRMAWGNVRKKGEKELVKPRVTTSQEYKE